MNKLEATKLVVNVVVGAGVTKIANDVIRNNIDDPEKLTQKVTTIAGAMVVGMMAKDASAKFVSTKIDSYVETWNKLKHKMREIPEEQKEAQ